MSLVKSPNNSESTQQKEEEDELKRQAIIGVFRRLAYLFLERWEKHFPDKESKVIVLKQWCKVLNHLTIPQIEAGIELIESDLELQRYLPTAASYRNLCLKQFYNTPSVEDAFKAAFNRDWIHPLVWHAYNAVGGSWAFTHEADAKLRPMFKQKYEELVERLYQGEVFNSPGVVTIEQTKPDTITDEDKFKYGSEQIKQIREQLAQILKGTPIDNLYGAR